MLRHSSTHRLALPWPSAQNASERSSMQMNTCARGCCAAASVSGDDLDPADPCTPQVSVPSAERPAHAASNRSWHCWQAAGGSRRTRCDGKGRHAAAAQLLDHEPRPQGIDIGRGCQRGRRMQERLKLTDLQLELLPLRHRNTGSCERCWMEHIWRGNVWTMKLSQAGC